jgi:hypothetical protein
MSPSNLLLAIDRQQQRRENAPSSQRWENGSGLTPPCRAE